MPRSRERIRLPDAPAQNVDAAGCCRVGGDVQPALARLSRIAIATMPTSRNNVLPDFVVLRSALAAVTAAALLSPPAVALAPAAGAGAPTASASTTRTASIQLSSSEQLAHPVVTGRLGPWARAEVWLAQSSEVDDGPFRGRVAVPGNPATIHTLPPPDESENNFMMKVRAVMFRSVDRSTERALIVLYSAAHIGPQQSVYYGACVYRWSGSEFVRVDAVEKRLAGARNSAEVIRRLAAGGQGK